MHYFPQMPYFVSLSPLCCPFYLQFYFPGSFSYLPFPSVVKFSLPITTTLPLFAPSVFCPQGVLSQSEANLPNYKPHLLFLSLSLSSFLVHLHSFTDTQELKQQKHLSSPNTNSLSFSFCHTVKKPIMHTSSLLPFPFSHSPFVLAVATLIWNEQQLKDERRRRGEDRRWAENREGKQEQEGKGDDEEAEEIGKKLCEEKRKIALIARQALVLCWQFVERSTDWMIMMLTTELLHCWPTGIRGRGRCGNSRHHGGWTEGAKKRNK